MNGENHYFILPDGTTFPLAGRVREVRGLGQVTPEYQTTRGFAQDGHTVTGMQLPARTLSFRLGQVPRSRTGHWDFRAELIAALQPLGTRSVIYRRVLPDGSRRQITGLLQNLDLTESGLTALDASFELVCPDPLWRDPTEYQTTLTSIPAEARVFPHYFYADGEVGEDEDGLWFDDSNVAGTYLDYAGTYKAYPMFLITGPYTWLRLDNITTGASFTLGVPLGAGETLTVTLQPGAQSIVDAVGASHFDHLTGGDIVNWYLTPGMNTVRASGYGSGPDTAITMAYQLHYLAI